MVYNGTEGLHDYKPNKMRIDLYVFRKNPFVVPYFAEIIGTAPNSAQIASNSA